MTGKVRSWRHYVVLGSFAVAILLLAWRAIDLQVINNERYQSKGDAAHLRVVSIPAHRGSIYDRNGEPLAISTPVESVWANPSELLEAQGELAKLASILGTEANALEARLVKRSERSFVYLKRRVTPSLAEQIGALTIPGLHLQREFRRYYPGGEVSAHVLGFTDVDDAGQEGVELAYDKWLRGTPGAKRVLQDRRGRSIANVERIDEPQEGRDLTLSIDRRLQYLAYRELKAVVIAHKARSGSIIVLNSRTGEILAMVNQPAFNPNSRASMKGEVYRNRAVTDLIEPGSTIKPFAVAAALESGRFHPNSIIDTTPGVFYVGRNPVRDIRNYGRINVSAIIQKSSNVGVSKLALALDKAYLWEKLVNVGFGSATGSGLPGEHGGLINDFHRWSRIDHATVAFGYGMAATTLQLARAYAVLADDGRLRPVSLQTQLAPSAGQPVLGANTTRRLLRMMEKVASSSGTAPLAKVPGYRIAGKTGTVKKNSGGRYSDNRYVALFAGIAPASRPNLVAVVVIDEPTQGEYYGGAVAAPVFASVMAGALRLLDIPPDDLNLTGGSGLRAARGVASGQVGSL